MKFTTKGEEPPDTHIAVKSETYLYILLKEDWL